MKGATRIGAALLTGLMLTAANSARAQTNFVSNGGFETLGTGQQSFAHWNEYRVNGTLGYDWFPDTPARSGNSAAVFASNTVETYLTQEVAGLTPGKTYNLSLWVAMKTFDPGDPTTPNSFSVRVGSGSFLNALSTTPLLSGTNLTSLTYEEYKTAFTATSSSMFLLLGGLNVPYRGLVDDVMIWIAGPSAAQTRLALQANRDSLLAVLNRRATAVAATADYDCASFGRGNWCLSFQARYSAFNSFNEGAGVLAAAYRLTDRIRLGAFLDYRVSEKEPVGIRFSHDLPTFGAFVGYGQNPDGTGLQGKVTTAVQHGDATIARPHLADTEPGSGKAGVTSYMFAGELGWGFAVSPSMLATPYVGLRHIDASRGAYSEAAVAGTVDSPIAYRAFHQRLTTATAGVRFTGMVTGKLGYRIGAGLEHDLGQRTSAYAGTSAISGLETFALATGSLKNRTRAVGFAGLSYQIEKNQRLTGQVSVRHQPHTSQPSVSAMAGFELAF